MSEWVEEKEERRNIHNYRNREAGLPFISPLPSFLPSPHTIGVLDKRQPLHPALVRLFLEGHPLLLQLRTGRVDVVTRHGNVPEASMGLLVSVVVLEVGLGLRAVVPGWEGGRKEG